MKLIKHTMSFLWGVVLLILLGNVFTFRSNASEVSIENIPILGQLEQEGKIFVVDQNGQGDFTSIMEGVNAVASDDTLVICPGVYRENVEIYNKTVNLIGMDRESCVIKIDSTKYYSIPLSISAGKVYNLTIHGTIENTDFAAPVIPPKPDPYDCEKMYEWRAAHPGYAIHIDWDDEYGRSLEFVNCKIISDNNCTVGIGTRGDYRLTFDSCEFIAKYETSCIFIHNVQNPVMSGAASFALKNCSFKNDRRSNVITIHSMGEVNPILLTFQNNDFGGGQNEAIQIWNDDVCGQIDGWNGLAYIYLNSDSYGNSVDIMNYSENNLFASE